MSNAFVGVLPKILITLLIGLVGGAIFDHFRLPLAWMLGALVFVTIATLGQLPTKMPQFLRQPMVAIIGVMLGGAFTPEMAARIPSWWPTLLGLFIFIGVTTAALYFYFRYIGKFDRSTALCCATPGGLIEMVTIAEDLGGNGRTVSLIHAARILITVMTIPFVFTAMGLYDQTTRSQSGVSLLEFPLHEWGLLLVSVVVGYSVASLLRIPAARLTGPMLLSATFHLLGWSSARPPIELIAIAQIIIGSALGARFAGVTMREIGRLLLTAVGSTIGMMAISVVFAIGFSYTVDESLPALVLAFAPGGLAEMSLVALALGVEAAFVATHHITRIGLIVTIAPILFKSARQKTH